MLAGDKRFKELKGKVKDIRKEGRATLRIAKKFKESNVSIDIIMKATGLTKEDIEEL